MNSLRESRTTQDQLQPPLPATTQKAPIQTHRHHSLHRQLTLYQTHTLTLHLTLTLNIHLLIGVHITKIDDITTTVGKIRHGATTLGQTHHLMDTANTPLMGKVVRETNTARQDQDIDIPTTLRPAHDGELYLPVDHF